MKTTLKLEQLGLLILFLTLYFFIQGFEGWKLFLILFFVPDLSIFFYLINKKIGAFAYNFMHHQGVWAFVIFLSFIFEFTDKNFLSDKNSMNILSISLIFLSHSAFDRILGYGLKFPDSPDHTHLGWIGKSKHKNHNP